MKRDLEAIAIVCHEANRAYCTQIGDSSQVEWRDAPTWQKESAIAGVSLLLTELDRGSEPSAKQAQESWRNEKLRNGWSYGPIKDADKKEHPCLVAWEQLPVEQRAKDHLFNAIVRAFWIAEQESK